jgi:hypothetical protein
MAEDYGWLNPHLSMSVTWDRVLRSTHHLQSNPEWAKWRPSDPTSPHWYDEARLRRLMGAQISRDQDLGRVPRTVREFVSEFRGLSGTAKQKLVLEEADAARLSLAEFFGVGERVNSQLHRDEQFGDAVHGPKQTSGADGGALGGFTDSRESRSKTLPVSSAFWG